MKYMTKYCAGIRAWEHALKSASEMKWTLAWIHGGYRQFCSTFGWSHSWMLGLCPVRTCWKNPALTGEGGSWGAAEPGASICVQALPPGAPQPQDPWRSIPDSGQEGTACLWCVPHLYFSVLQGISAFSPCCGECCTCFEHEFKG